jgi:hypothetical protein
MADRAPENGSPPVVPPERRTAYDEMIQLLRAQKADQSKGHLANSLTALRFMVRFLNSDPRCVNEELALPLERLSQALVDVQQGAKPALFRIENPGRGAPANQARQAALGALAAAVSMLKNAGETREESAKLIERAAKKLGLAWVDAVALLQCRDDISRGRASTRARDIYARHMVQARGLEKAALAHLASDIVMAVASQGFG